MPAVIAALVALMALTGDLRGESLLSPLSASLLCAGASLGASASRRPIFQALEPRRSSSCTRAEDGRGTLGTTQLRLCEGGMALSRYAE